MDRRRDGAARQRRTSMDVKSRHRKMMHAPTRAPTRPHAHPRAGAWTASSWREAARDGAYRAVFRWGCHRRVDRPHAPQNLRFSAGEELAGKSPAAAATRKSDDGGFREENKVTGMKHDHRKSKLGFPFGFDTL